MGGSTTRNASLPRQDRYPNVLQHLLEKYYPELNIQIFNAGMNWYTTKHSLINYSTDLMEWKPDLVIVMHAINDLYRSFTDTDYSTTPYDRYWSHYYGPSINGAKPPTFFKWFFQRFFSRFSRCWFSEIRYQEKNMPLHTYVSIKDFSRYFQKLAHYLKSDNVGIVLLTQPYLYKKEMSAEEVSTLWFGREFCTKNRGLFRYYYPSPLSLRNAMDAFNLATKELSVDADLLLIDLESALPKDLQYFSDDVHYTKLGARRVAEIVADKLISMGLIKCSQ